MIIITGGAGFIGSALAWRLNQAGHQDVIIVDALGSGNKWQNLVKNSPADIVHRDNLFDWLSKTDPQRVSAIFHMGACSSTMENDMDFLLDNNFKYSCRLFEFCALNKIPFVYASSAATYGMAEHGFGDDTSTTHKLKPINKYGYSKQLFDLWALAQKSRPPTWVGFKFFNVYGPQEYHKGSQASVVYHAYPQVRDNKRLRLFKSYRDGVAHGEQKRDFVYIKDVVDVMTHVYENAAECTSGIYNLGTGQARPFADLGRAVFKALDIPVEIEFIDMPEQLKAQYQYFTEADMSRMREQLKYDKEFISLERGVEQYVAQYLAAEDSYL
jgi:ADP-L-glycero-D-manno-heptose 6-epimerase